MRVGYPDPHLGEYLLELAEAWARERMVQAELGVRVTLMGWLPNNDAVGRQRYEHAGLQENRRFWDMELEMNEKPPVPVWSEEIELRPYVLGRDERLAFDLVETAFQDIWGNIPLRFEEFRHTPVERPTFDPSLWFLAYEGTQAVGAALCRDEGESGWVDDLAVLRTARGKGLATTLLLHAFGELYRRAQRKVSLGVDSQSLTGRSVFTSAPGCRHQGKSEIRERTARGGGIKHAGTQRLRD